MKRTALLRHLRLHGCYLKREGRSHSPWTNRETGEVEAVPRHTEIPDRLARKICRGLSVPEIRIRGSDPSKLRLSAAYYVQPGEINCFFQKFDEYQRMSG